MTSEVDKILARVAQVAENNPIARDIFEQRQVVGQQLPEGMQPHSEYRFNPTTDALESTESDGRFMAYADGMDSLKDAGLGGLKGGCIPSGSCCPTTCLCSNISLAMGLFSATCATLARILSTSLVITFLPI
jgi:hypothetical protein